MTSLHDIHQPALCKIATSLVAHCYRSTCRYPTLPRLCREVRIRMLMYLLVHILLDKTRLKKKEIAQLVSIYSPICPSSLGTCSAFLITGLVLKHGIIIKKPQVLPSLLHLLFRTWVHIVLVHALLVLSSCHNIVVVFWPVHPVVSPFLGRYLYSMNFSVMFPAGIFSRVSFLASGDATFKWLWFCVSPPLGVRTRLLLSRIHLWICLLGDTHEGLGVCEPGFKIHRLKMRVQWD